MNPFYAMCCVLMVCASLWALYHGSPLSAGIAASYAVANGLLTFVKG